MLAWELVTGVYSVYKNSLTCIFLSTFLYMCVQQDKDIGTIIHIYIKSSIIKVCCFFSI